MFPEMIINGTVLDQQNLVYKLDKVENLTSSSPPGTAQEFDSQVDETPIMRGKQPGNLNNLTGFQTVNPATYRTDDTVRSSQPPPDQGKSLEEASLRSNDHVRESRLNTGNNGTVYNQPLTDTEASKIHLDTQHEPRKYKNKRNSQFKENNTHSDKNGISSGRQQTANFDQIFNEKNQILQAMDQTIGLLESFGGVEYSVEPNSPAFKYSFENQQQATPPSTKQDLGYVDTQGGPTMRESYERKVVPLNPKQVYNITSGLTSHDGRSNGEVPSKLTIELNKTRQSMLTKDGTDRDSPRTQGNSKFVPQIQLSTMQKQSPRSPRIKDKMKMMNDSPPPIDITMTNYAIDKSL